MSSDMERRIVNLERIYQGLLTSSRELNTKALRLDQEFSVIRNALQDNTSPQDTVSNICTTGVSFILNLKDTYYNLDTGITWDGVDSWRACAIVNKPVTNLGGCPAGLTAIFYRLVANIGSFAPWNFYIQWVKATVGTCPKIGSTCADAPYTGSLVSGSAEYSCSPGFNWAISSVDLVNRGILYPPATFFTISIQEYP
jgi:hypothetical protein